MEVIRRLCSFEGRRAGTDAERRAANYLAERLREAGRRVEVEPTYVHPQYPLVHAVHCLLGIAGSLASLQVPALGFALVLAAALSMYLDLNTRLYLVRRLFFRRASQNVVSRGPPARRPSPSDPVRPLRRGPDRTRLRPPLGAARRAAPGPPPLPHRPLPDRVLVARVPAPHPRRADGRGRRRLAIADPARPHPGADRLRLPARRRRAVGRRPRRQRQRVGRRDRPRARRGAGPRSARAPRRLGAADRRRGGACRRECGRS